MKDAIEDKDKQKHFSPDEEIIEFMHKRLHMEKIKNKLKYRGEKLSDKDQMEDHRLRIKKVRLLNNIIFPAMANLTYFFECVANHPELQSIFEDDLKDLFGIRHNYEYDLKKNDPLLADDNAPKSQEERKYIQNLKIMGKNPKRGFMFERLISAALTWDLNGKEKEKNDTKNFRLILLGILQNICYFRVQRLLLSDFTTETASIVDNDIGRARAWINLYSSKVVGDADDIPPHRTFKFESI
jgi:hypothetical protein